MIRHLSFGYMSDYILPEQFDLSTLRHELQHDLALLVIVDRVVLVVADLLEQQPVPRRQTHIHVVVRERVRQEPILQVAPEDLND